MSDYDVSRYIQDCKRTAPSQPHFVVFDEMRHAAYGLVTEAGELLRWQLSCGNISPIQSDKEKWRDELGDIMWYAALMLHHHKMPIDAVLRMASNYSIFIHEDRGASAYSVSCGSDVQFSVMSIAWRAAHILDFIKKQTAYGKEYDFDHDELPTVINDKAPLPLLKMIVAHVAQIGAYYGYTVQEIMGANIAKLRKRFPKQFESDLAINKDVDAEMEAQRRA